LTQFSDFGLAEPIAKALAAEGYHTPTPIQAQAIPSVMTGRDLCGIAQTGTGKTAAFALPTLHRLSLQPKSPTRGSVRCLVLAPTRELASQIADSFRAYGRFMRLSVNVVFGGVPINKQIRDAGHGVDIMVATPGRLIDLIDRGAVDLRKVEVLVLDEADQMLDLGFIHALKRIVQILPNVAKIRPAEGLVPKDELKQSAFIVYNQLRADGTPATRTGWSYDAANKVLVGPRGERVKVYKISDVSTDGAGRVRSRDTDVQADGKVCIVNIQHSRMVLYIDRAIWESTLSQLLFLVRPDPAYFEAVSYSQGGVVYRVLP